MWAERRGNEVSDAADALAGLTAQERRIAELVGGGASNKAVARVRSG